MTDELPLAQFVLAAASEIFKKFNTSKIDYDGILKALVNLEVKLGPIPAFALAEKLPEPHREKRYEYLLLEGLQPIKDMIGVASRRGDEIPWLTPRDKASLPKQTIDPNAKESSQPTKLYNLNLVQKLLSKLGKTIFPSSNEDLISRYVRMWESLYNIYVVPIWELLKDSPYFDPKLVTRRGRAARIQHVISFLEQHDDLKMLSFLFQGMNTDLRNAAVHMDYYIHNKTKELWYFFQLENQIQSRNIPLKELEDLVLYFCFLRVIMQIIIGQKLGYKLAIDYAELFNPEENKSSGMGSN
ncbi:MAG: hypothetical protein ACXADY_16805 [Candidatus Hodarchaeales archaeon]|jgi:hypothetical protein